MKPPVKTIRSVPSSFSDADKMAWMVANPIIRGWLLRIAVRVKHSGLPLVLDRESHKPVVDAMAFLPAIRKAAPDETCAKTKAALVLQMQKVAPVPSTTAYMLIGKLIQSGHLVSRKAIHSCKGCSVWVNPSKTGVDISGQTESMDA